MLDSSPVPDSAIDDRTDSLCEKAARTAIVLERVSKLYPNEKALEDVSLSLLDDVTTAIVGPSGSGKSTLLQCINGLVRPSGGTVYVFGRPIDYDRLPELRRQIGYAVQGTGLFPHLTVEGNITLLAQLAGWDRERIRARVEELMKLVDLPPSYARRHPHELSGGQQQRVGLCRAMMLNPRVFLLDEPFGALDPVTRTEIHREFLRLQEVEPRTIVLVTHDLREARKLAQRLIVLERGRLAQQGTFEEILKDPADEFVRNFFQSQLEA
ncbi:MAG TPA: ABC transporter ATP-binding protein [Gemmataceae bacterium]|jgi:osmoprotectant transport system ATP-binding protein